MSKIGKSFFAKLIGGDEKCCCCGPSIVSVKKIKIDNEDMEIVGLDEEFEKLQTSRQAPDNVNVDELIHNIAKINTISEDKSEAFKIIILNEYTKYWNEKRT